MAERSAPSAAPGRDRAPVVPPGSPPPLAIVGVTASGKSALALELARRRSDVELVSVDSMQVYRGMDVGTAKPTAAERAEVRHHLLDLVDPWETFDVASFQGAVRTVLADIAERGRRAVLVGGTGLYLRAVVDDLDIPGRFPDVAAGLAEDPDTVALHARLAELDHEAAARMEPTNRRRVLRALEVTLGGGRPFSSYGPGLDAHPPTPVHLVGLWLPRPVVAQRIERRYREQLAAGFLAEVERLAAGPPLSRTAAQALGYRELLAHVRGEVTLEGAVAEAVTRTRQFARRQRVWFRKDPRITWIGADDDPLVALPALLDEAAACWDRR
ncbi:MAG TPA: tRNA (adenosine(37)-N6)-dimethylallyltransferase MiaA [Aquihabitans sp.]|jgi:tRNA dimethylallyltransferase|nr:tRNA (adenosine(37)-N6)-dimethylallyltransferase MiaA [Aquihabitans sp.]